MILIHQNNINIIHKVRAKVSASVVQVKICGSSPRKLFITIIRNNDVKIKEFPLFSFPFLRIFFYFLV